MELLRIAQSNLFTDVGKLVKEKRPPEPVLFNKSKEADEGESGQRRKRQLHNRIIRPNMLAIAAGARKKEV